MTEQPYSNREMDKFFLDLKTQLDRIETQTTLTNGRTTKNERELAQINTKINTTIWAFGITVPIIIVLSVFILGNGLDI